MAYWADLRRRRPLRFRLRGGMFDLFRSRLKKVFARDVYLYFTPMSASPSGAVSSMS